MPVICDSFPSLHPDGFDDADSGWPRPLKRFAAEAWRRADAGELADEQLYPMTLHGADFTTGCTHMSRMKWIGVWL